MTNFATVLIGIPRESGFTYQIPEQLSARIKPGMQVVVPFGNRYLPAIVWKVFEKIPEELIAADIKQISDCLSDQPLIGDDLLRLIEWISEYYLCFPGEAARLVSASLHLKIPPIQVQRNGEKSAMKLSRLQQEIMDLIPENGSVSIDYLQKKMLRKNLKPHLLKMANNGAIERTYQLPRPKKIYQVSRWIEIVPAEDLTTGLLEKRDKVLAGRATRQRELLILLAEIKSVSMEELKKRGFSAAVIKGLQEKELIKIIEKPVLRSFKTTYSEQKKELTLNAEQSAFLELVRPKCRASEFGVFLLHGITGSGKTQIYIELIKEVINAGKTVIVLIPEIVLTPQTLARFQNYYGEQVGFIHSKLTHAEKREVLFSARDGRFKIILGPRSALFAPLENIGLIVVDEEHEASYKQSDVIPRYHARDAAVYRARLNNAVVVLGSATPSFESLYNARTGIYQYYFLNRRATDGFLPRISLIDLKKEWNRIEEYPVLSENLELKTEARLICREQMMVLQNRRGYAPFLFCTECGFISKCNNCDITLTYHRKTHELVCHYCNHREDAVDKCPQCGGIDVLYKGIGTQKLEELFKDLFPHARILRMDQDTTRMKKGYEKILNEFKNGGADILLGTKMIAKGLDFHNVTLVGIASADQGLHFPDFRATEKVFQILTQAAGRSGRGAIPGEVVIQTFDPKHYIFQFLNTHDYVEFYKKEMQTRYALKYPPFSRLMLVRFEGESEEQVAYFSEVAAKYLRQSNENNIYQVLGPSQAPILKIKNAYRYQILIRQPKDKDASMRFARQIVRNGLLKNADVQKWPVKVVIDMEPLEIL